MTWRLTLDTLLGRPLPPLPEIPGRVHTLATADDRMTPEDAQEALLSSATDAELATEFNCTRQAIWQRRQRLRLQQTTTRTEGTT